MFAPSNPTPAPCAIARAGHSYRIQASTNLAGTDWTDLVNFTNTAETMQFLDNEGTNLPTRFYRAVSP